MEINYVENKNGKLFSFYRHDFKENIDDENNHIMIDGGFDYTRFSGELKSDKIINLINDIREQFIWGNNYDKNKKKLSQTKYLLLKDITTSHICGVLKYFTESLIINQSISKQWIIYHLIFLYELEFRLKK